MNNLFGVLLKDYSIWSTWGSIAISAVGQQLALPPDPQPAVTEPVACAYRYTAKYHNITHSVVCILVQGHVVHARLAMYIAHTYMCAVSKQFEIHF